MINEKIKSTLSSATVSYWLKNALRAALERDLLDASVDADELAYLLRARLDERKTEMMRMAAGELDGAIYPLGWDVVGGGGWAATMNERPESEALDTKR